MGLLNLNKNAPLDTLLRVYRDRKDLQEVYGEADSGDYRRLIDWACGVSNGQWVDSSYTILRPHGRWYKKNFTGAMAAPPIPWNNLKSAAQHAANPLRNALALGESGEAEDISQHLVTLSLLVTEFGLQEIVELGTRMGSSTLALLEAVNQIGGHVLSIDLDPCHEAQKKVAASGLGHLWRFIQGDDLEVPESEIPRSIDLLFIDTSHLYEPTLGELRKYAPRVRLGGWIAFHDYISFAGVTRAVGEFMASSPQQMRFYPYVHQNGLALLKLVTAAA